VTRPWRYSALPLRPPSRWPGGARIALWVAVGVESYRPDDGCTEDILPRGPAPDLVNAAWRDYGNRAGAFRLFDRLSALGVRPALLLNSDLYDEAPEVIAAARAVGAEIVAHGLSNSDALPEMTAEQERAYIETCAGRIAAAEGSPAQGWSTPWLQHRATTLDHLKAAGFDYVLDFRLDDQPVWLSTGAGPLLSIPYAAELNDSSTMIGRMMGPADFAQAILDEFEALRGWGDQAVVMSVVLHSFISGQPFRLRPVADALARIAARSDVWLATPSEIHAAVLAAPERAAPA
jgi:peptidoglycan/xylan/chitin deacetylase (PgdA/CDA1 family)